MARNHDNEHTNKQDTLLHIIAHKSVLYVCVCVCVHVCVCVYVCVVSVSVCGWGCVTSLKSILSHLSGV